MRGSCISPDASFDAALSLLVFNFIPDPKKALSELRRVTKPGGRLSAGVWDYGEGMRMLRMFWDAAVHIDPGAAKLDEKHMPLCRAGELSALWRQGGLENVGEQSIEIKMRFESFADYCVTDRDIPRRFSQIEFVGFRLVSQILFGSGLSR